MRALRKIVFVNSAHIRYAEVKLDGNVHFIGTQGVGKSTLLRAILFFYNADKLHLGIPKEMKTFDEFYLPHANSYIVYEVEHEHGPFSVLTFRSSGRACFRFVDAPYSKDWLVDDHGEVTADSKVIRQRTGNAYMSKIVDRYELYRDIIYGNRQAVGKEFARFQLMESNRYRNIPRSIQNVFLNSRLDADFIKDIIIRSMSEEEANIDLGYFRRQVADFEQEYKDISCWYKFDAKGACTVRKQADAVVNAYHELLYLKQRLAELCGELNWAVRTSRERLPLLGKRISELLEEEARQKRLLDELEQKLEQERRSIHEDQGSVKDKLNRAKERREFYAKLNMDEVLARCSKEQAVRGELAAQEVRLTDLTARYNDVTAKYKALCQGLENRLAQYCQTQKEHELALGHEKQEKNEKLLEDYQKRCATTEESFEEKLSLSINAIDLLKSEQVEVEKELLKLSCWQPYEEDIEALRKELDGLSSSAKELEARISAAKADGNQLQAKLDKEEAELKAHYGRLLESKQKEKAEAESQIEERTRLLERIKGSLYEWLEENQRGWEQNIGKVIHDEHVLYRTGLNPQKAEGASLFGVKLNLSDLPSSVRKPTQLKEEKAALETTVETLKHELADLSAEQEKQTNSLRARYSDKMKALLQRKAALEMELRVVPQKQKALKVKIESLLAKGQQEKKVRQQELATRQQDIAVRRTAADNTLSKLKTDKRKQLAQAEKAYQAALTAAAEAYGKATAEIQADMRKQEERTEAELRQLQSEEREALKGRGADTAMVDDCRKAIATAQAELKYIDDNRRLVFDYQRDKEELFDHEEELKERRKLLADKLQQLNEKYALRRQKHDGLLSTLRKDLAECQKDKSHIEDGLQKAERFSHSELCPPTLADGHERQTLLTPSEAVDELTGAIVSRNGKQKHFEQSVNLFKQNFSAKNTFHFRTELTLEEDFLDFANNLDDFLLNNKIEEYRRRTGERYVEILSRISKEMGELTRHESDVDKIIRDINADFRERNFAGVIKLIALQSVPSSDKMVQLLKCIKEFNDENQFAMGELNLFSSANRDEVNQKAVGHLLDFMKQLLEDPQRQQLTLSDLFQLQFRIVENDNDTGWADKLSHVGSEGTDTLVKAMVNIMLINVFKEKVSKRFGDFRIHCMMDEIGKLHPQNVKGILDFANARNILLINSSPTTYNVSDYRYTYLLCKDAKSQTVVRPLVSQA